MFYVVKLFLRGTAVSTINPSSSAAPRGAEDLFQVAVTPPRPGLLQTAGYTDLLESFTREIKKRPTGEAWLKVGEIVFEGMKRNEGLLRAAATDPALTRKLVAAGAILPENTKDLLGINKQHLVPLPKPLEIEIRRKGFFYTQLLTHPAILQGRILMQGAGYVPLPGKEIPLFEQLNCDYVASTYEDFGLQPQQPLPDDGVEESVSRIIAQGCFSWISRNHVGFPTTSNSMPCTNSAEALAALSLIGTFACIPTDGHLATLESRLSLVRSAQRAIEEHPVVTYHKHRDYELSNGRTVQEELKSRTSFLVATLKQDPRTIVEEAKAFYAEGIRVFRVYDAGSTNQLYGAPHSLHSQVTALKDQLPSDITVLAGQVVGPDQGRLLVEAGADGLIVGIGEGGICTTPVVASLASNNIMVVYELCKAGLPVPIFCDGGVGNAAGVAFSMGASASMASRRIIGGTIEQTPSLYWIKRDGQLQKPYAGEASEVTKIEGGNLTMVGDPYNVEGISSFVDMNEAYPSIARLYLANLAGLAKVLRFSRARSLTHLQQRPNNNSIKIFSPGARAAAGAHHVQKDVRLNRQG